MRESIPQETKRSRISTEPCLGAAGSVHRLIYAAPGKIVKTWIVKDSTPRELAVLRVLNAEIPDVAPRVLDSWPTGDDRISLLMEDASELPCVPAARSNGLPDFVFPESGPPDHSFFQEALRLLAITHGRFLGSTAALDGKLPVLAPGSMRMGCAALALCLGLLDASPDSRKLEALRGMDPLLLEQAAILNDPIAHTLLHGDFHLANIARAQRVVRILDWGEAMIGPAAWDLALCGESDINFYLSVRASFNSGLEPVATFPVRLRAAVICRMHRLLEVAMSKVLAGEGRWSGPAIGVCLDRLLTAASSPEFRGGAGIQFSFEQLDVE
jgi:hypothetical protein